MESRRLAGVGLVGSQPAEVSSDDPGETVLDSAINEDLLGRIIIDLEGAKERFECFSNILKRDLLEICSNTEIQDNQDLNLNNTKNTQPALFIVESILLDALKKQGRLPSIVAGHSLGEITALYAAEVLSLEDCFNLINLRSTLMSECSEGSMAAIIGFNREELVELINHSEDIVLANDNSDMQVVVSGTTKAISFISENIKCDNFKIYLK